MVPLTATDDESPGLQIRYNSAKRKMILEIERTVELLAPFVSRLSAAKIDAVSIYLDLLMKWNAKINLTAVRDPEEIITRHFGESLFAARHLFPESESATVADIGSGAGFPGIPIKIWNDGARLNLIEANQRKAVFLREVVRTLNLQNVAIQSVRAEKLRLTAGVVTLRAVERFENMLLSARTQVKPGGRLALLIGESQVDVAKSVLGDLVWQSAIAIPLSRSRRLLIGTVS